MQLESVRESGKRISIFISTFGAIIPSFVELYYIFYSISKLIDYGQQAE